MARINSMGMDEILDSLHAQARASPKIMKHMLEAAGDVYVEETKLQIHMYGIIDKGTTLNSIKRGRSKKKGDGVRLEVWPSGTRVDENHPKGERNETIAFVTEYGVSDGEKEIIAPRPFMATAAINAAQPALVAMEAVLERESKL